MSLANIAYNPVLTWANPLLPMINIALVVIPMPFLQQRNGVKNYLTAKI